MVWTQPQLIVQKDSLFSKLLVSAWFASSILISIIITFADLFFAFVPLRFPDGKRGTLKCSHGHYAN